MKISNRFVVSALVGGALLVGVAGGYALAAQPHMQAALGALNTALSELQVAEHNKGGHRANATSLVRQAITQVNAGIAAGG